MTQLHRSVTFGKVLNKLQFNNNMDEHFSIADLENYLY